MKYLHDEIRKITVTHPALSELFVCLQIDVDFLSKTVKLIESG